MKVSPKEFQLKNNKRVFGWQIGVCIDFILIDAIKDYELYLNNKGTKPETQRLKVFFDELDEDNI